MLTPKTAQPNMLKTEEETTAMAKKLKKIVLILALILYLFTLLWYTIGNYRTPSYIYSVNFVPFRTIIGDAVKEGALGDAASVWHTIKYNVLNLLMLVPLGVLLPLITEKLKTYKRFLWFPLLLSIFIELTQYVFHIGACDVDDVILNFAGASIGFFVVYLLREYNHSRRKSNGRNLSG